MAEILDEYEEEIDEMNELKEEYKYDKKINIRRT